MSEHLQRALNAYLDDLESSVQAEGEDPGQMARRASVFQAAFRRIRQTLILPAMESARTLLQHRGYPCEVILDHDGPFSKGSARDSVMMVVGLSKDKTPSGLPSPHLFITAFPLGEHVGLQRCDAAGRVTQELVTLDTLTEPLVEQLIVDLVAEGIRRFSAEDAWKTQGLEAC